LQGALKLSAIDKMAVIFLSKYASIPMHYPNYGQPEHLTEHLLL